jgi:hydrogenase maturation protease
LSVERITVMGIGNPLMMDEGVGVRVMEVMMGTLQFPENVTLIDAGTMGMGILNIFQECDYLLVIDAVDGTGEPPGTVVRLSPEDLAPNQVKHSMHDIRLVDVLEAAMLMGNRPQAECIGVQIEDMGAVRIGLTPDVEAAVPAALAAALEILAEHGVTATIADNPSAEAGILEAIRTFTTAPRPSHDA